MSDLPAAGWYDDPENPSQYRYWDGAQWTEHRSAKQTPSPPGSASHEHPRSASEVVGASFSVMSQNVGPLIGLAAIAAGGFIVAVIPFIAGFFFLLEEEQRAFGSSEFNWTWDPVGIALWMIGLVIYLAVILVMFPAFQARIEHARRQTTVSVGRCLRYGIRNIGRTFVRGLLVWLAYLLTLFAPIAGIAVLAALVSPWFWVLVVGAIAWWIYVLPILSIAIAGVAVAPDGTRVLGFAVDAARKDWGLAAGGFYLAYAVTLGISFASGILGLIPILGLITSLVLGFVQYTFFLIVVHYQWVRVGGAIDPAIEALRGDWRAQGTA